MLERVNTEGETSGKLYSQQQTWTDEKRAVWGNRPVLTELRV